MALIKCKDCKQDMSDRADFCPNCGFKPNNFNKKQYSTTNNEEQNAGPGCAFVLISSVCAGIGNAINYEFFIPGGIFGLIIGYIIVFVIPKKFSKMS